MPHEDLNESELWKRIAETDKQLMKANYEHYASHRLAQGYRNSNHSHKVRIHEAYQQSLQGLTIGPNRPQRKQMRASDISMCVSLGVLAFVLSLGITEGAVSPASSLIIFLSASAILVLYLYILAGVVFAIRRYIRR